MYSNTPLLLALLMYGPQIKAHIAQLVILKIDILQKTRQTASLPLMPLQDTKQKNN
jgi:hypothetical protein